MKNKLSILPDPWTIPKDLFKQILQIDKLDKEVDNMCKDIRYSQQITDEKRSEVNIMWEKMLDILMDKMEEDGIVFDNNAYGLFIHRKKKQVIFLDEYENFLEEIEDYPADIKNVYKTIAPYIKQRSMISEKYLNQILSDLFNGRVKIT